MILIFQNVINELKTLQKYIPQSHIWLVFIRYYFNAIYLLN